MWIGRESGWVGETCGRWQREPGQAFNQGRLLRRRLDVRVNGNERPGATDACRAVDHKGVVWALLLEDGFAAVGAGMGWEGEKGLSAAQRQALPAQRQSRP